MVLRETYHCILLYAKYVFCESAEKAQCFVLYSVYNLEMIINRILLGNDFFNRLLRVFFRSQKRVKMNKLFFVRKRKKKKKRKRYGKFERKTRCLFARGVIEFHADFLVPSLAAIITTIFRRHLVG